MDNKKIKSVKEILGLEELSPLETGEIHGGADKQKQKQKVKTKGGSDDVIIGTQVDP